MVCPDSTPCVSRVMSKSICVKQSPLGFYLLLFLMAMPWRSGCLVSSMGTSFNASEINLGAPISRIVVSEYSGVFVGGTNFVAHLSRHLQLLYQFSIGPVLEPEYCWPQSAPCDNTVRVMEIDHDWNLLLVCGTAYQGTCTLHNMVNIYDYYYCLSGNVFNSTSPYAAAQQPSPSVLSPSRAGDAPAFSQAVETDAVDWEEEESQDVPGTVVHFLKKKKLDSDRQTDTDFTNTPCRSDLFGEAAFFDPVGGRTGRIARETGVAGSYNLFSFSSTLLAAGVVTFPGNVSLTSGGDPGVTPRASPLPLSVREISFSNIQYSISYSPGAEPNTPQGFQMAPNTENFYQDYKLSFSHGNFSYLVFLQREICADGQPCIVTRVGRLCHNSPTLTPYIDIKIQCSHGGETYQVLTSAVLGSVDIQQSSSLESLPLLVVAFGARRQDAPAARRVDPRQGGAVCIFGLDRINEEMMFIKQMCDTGVLGATIVSPPSWIKASNPNCIPYSMPEDSDVCSSASPNRHVQGKAAMSGEPLVGFQQTAVASLWSYTPRQYYAGIVQKMGLFMLTLDGRISKITLRIEQENKKAKVITSDFGVSEYQKLDIQLTTANGTWNGQPIPVGATDNIGAFMYISNGNKVMYLSLDYCRQFSSCTDCRSHEGVCQWCPAERACRSADIAGQQCKTSLSQICPPKLDDFFPFTVPHAGGSVLTLFGNNIGSEVDEMERVIVSVCGEYCDNVTKGDDKGNSIKCILREQCDGCPDSCSVMVIVEHVEASHKLIAHQRLSYVTPRIDGVKPLYGPISGQTQVTISGQYIGIGSKVSVKVAGMECRIIERERDTLLCQVIGERGAVPRCGPVEVTIDNFHATFPNMEFCLREDPHIRKITPASSIESGGTTVTIEGAHLNSANIASLILSPKYDEGQNVSQLQRIYTSECKVPKDNEETMTCLSPIVEDMNRLLLNIAEKKGQKPVEVKHVTFDLLLKLDWRDVVEDAIRSGRDDVASSFTVYRDPTIFRFPPGSESSFVDVRNPVVEIRGNNVPTWLSFSDIRVTIGNWTCPVTRLTRRLIVCNAAEAASYVVDQAIDTNTTDNPTTSTDDLESTSPYPDTLETDAERNGTISFTDVTRSTPAIRTREMFNETVTWLPEGLSASKLLGSRGPEEIGAVNDHERETETEPRLREIAIEFEIQISIGNLKLDLGAITLGYDASRPVVTTTKDPGVEEEENEFDIRRVAGPVAGGAFILLSIAAIVLCCQLVKSKRRTREMKKMAPYYMGSISGSGPGSKENALPTLKDILESIMEPTRRSEVDNLIIQLDRLTIGKSIGSGNFGCVYEGLLEQEGGQPPQRIAVKTLQDGNSQSLDLKAFVQEAVLMKDFRHPHVLGLVGLSERAGPAGSAPYVILPYMENGDLLTYVRDPHVSISLHDVIKFGADIASGMAYLSALKFVHRDLAARNCMLDSLHRAKVADFGLCRDIYEKGYYTSDNRKKLPIRWMAVESIEHGAYSTKSDVWSFGVVLWELSCRGVTPYPGVDGWDVINYLRKRRLAPPFFCPDELYNVMMLCWAKDPDKRPDFNTLHADLMAMIGQSSAAMPPIAAKRRASEGFSPAPSPTSPVSPQFKLPEVIGPMGKKAQQQMARSNSDIEKGLDQPTNSSYKNIAVISEEVAQAALESKRLSASGASGSGASGIASGGGAIPGNRRSSVTVVVTGPPKAVIKNVNITIPTCFDHRDLSRSVAAEYITLVDNYEPAPKFSNSFKLKTRRSKKSAEKGDAGKDRASVQKRSKKPPVAPRSSKTKSGMTDSVALPRHTSSNASGYSSLVFDQPDGTRASAGSVRVTGFSYGVREDGNYFELETTGVRASAASDGVSGRLSGRSSFNNGSVASLLDNRSGHASSSPSMSRASAASSRTSTPGVQRSPRSQLAGTSGRSNSNAAKQLPVIEQLKAGMSRPYSQVAKEESFIVDDEISSCFDTDL